MAELKQVEDALSQAQQEENQLPETIKHLEQVQNTHGHKALQLKKKLKPIEGSADEDVKEIEAADQIRLRAKYVSSSSATHLPLPALQLS